MKIMRNKTFQSQLEIEYYLGSIQMLQALRADLERELVHKDRRVPGIKWMIRFIDKHLKDKEI